MELTHDTVFVGEGIELPNIRSEEYDLYLEGTLLIQEKGTLGLQKESTLFVKGDLRIQEKLDAGS
jgi:hypothetical protein